MILFSDAKPAGELRDAETALEKTRTKSCGKFISFPEEKKKYFSQFPDWIRVHRCIIRWSIELMLGNSIKFPTTFKHFTLNFSLLFFSLLCICSFYFPGSFIYVDFKIFFEYIEP